MMTFSLCLHVGNAMCIFMGKPQSFALGAKKATLSIALSLIILNLEERKGFEPLIRFEPYTHFPGVRLQPLGHLSMNNICTINYSQKSRLLFHNKNNCKQLSITCWSVIANVVKFIVFLVLSDFLQFKDLK